MTSPDPRLAALRAARGWLQAQALFDIPEAMVLLAALDALAAAEAHRHPSPCPEAATYALRMLAAEKERDALAARLAGAERVIDEARKMSVPMVYGSSQDWEDQAQARMTRLHQTVAAYDDADGAGRRTK